MSPDPNKDLKTVIEIADALFRTIRLLAEDARYASPETREIRIAELLDFGEDVAYSFQSRLRRLLPEKEWGSFLAKLKEGIK